VNPVGELAGKFLGHARVSGPVGRLDAGENRWQDSPPRRAGVRQSLL